MPLFLCRIWSRICFNSETTLCKCKIQCFFVFYLFIFFCRNISAWEKNLNKVRDIWRSGLCTWHKWFDRAGLVCLNTPWNNSLLKYISQLRLSVYLMLCLFWYVYVTQKSKNEPKFYCLLAVAKTLLLNFTYWILRKREILSPWKESHCIMA